MLELRELKKSFGGTTVLQGVDLTVQQGDVIAVIGPSGSGKTTLLRCMNFLETADSGALTFDGETLDLARVRKKDAARLRRKTAFVFQSYNLFANKTALENVTVLISFHIHFYNLSNVPFHPLTRLHLLHHVQVNPS